MSQRLPYPHPAMDDRPPEDGGPATWDEMVDAGRAVFEGASVFTWDFAEGFLDEASDLLARSVIGIQDEGTRQEVLRLGARMALYEAGYLNERTPLPFMPPPDPPNNAQASMIGMAENSFPPKAEATLEMATLWYGTTEPVGPLHRLLEYQADWLVDVLGNGIPEAKGLLGAVGRRRPVPSVDRSVIQSLLAHAPVHLRPRLLGLLAAGGRQRTSR